jgi:hypothetical protein
MKRILLLAPACLLACCAGYHAGGSKPAVMAGVETIAVPMFANATQHPRAEAIATSAVADAFVRDGTYRITGSDRADAILEGTVHRIEYSPLRGTRFDTLLAEEFRSVVILNWTLRDARNPMRVIATGTSEGRSQLFRDSNLQTARNNALPDAMESAGDALVSLLADSP